MVWLKSDLLRHCLFEPGTVTQLVEAEFSQTEGVEFNYSSSSLFR